MDLKEAGRFDAHHPQDREDLSEAARARKGKNSTQCIFVSKVLGI